MARVYKLEEAQDAGLFEDAAVAFGVFDGFHRGHQYLVGQTLRRAQQEGERCVVLTFDIDPDELFCPEALQKLMTNEARLDTLAQSGADAVVTLPFTRQFASLDPTAFLERTFGNQQVGSMHVGADIRFGYKGAGTVDDLHLWSERTGTEIVAYQLAVYDGLPITATRIRQELAAGHAAVAAELLGRPWRMEGTVEHGRGEGADMGFATANLSVPARLQAIAEGVYAAYVLVGDKRYKAAVSVGASPTFEDATATCEVHILDFTGDIYGQRISVDFVEWLRPMMVFASTEELISTVMGNINWVRNNL